MSSLRSSSLPSYSLSHSLSHDFQHRLLLRWTLLWLGITNFERLLPQLPPLTSSLGISRLQLSFATFRPLMELLRSTLEVLQRRPASTIEASLYSLRLPPSTLEALQQLPLLTVQQLLLLPQLSSSVFQQLQQLQQLAPSTFLQFLHLTLQMPLPLPSSSTWTWIWPPSMAPYSPRGLLTRSFTPPNSFTPPGLPMLQASPLTPMRSTHSPSHEMPSYPPHRFSPTATQLEASSLSVFEAAEWLEKALRGVSKCAYVMLRCALVCDRIQ
jgi:hypothetical protein